ncbi:MAG: helix-hairpin-helix domain-containing protein [Bacilli bacterium]|nr:helix-hairpin-helix domain-containing protein [Bacilli bacterium]
MIINIIKKYKFFLLMFMLVIISTIAFMLNNKDRVSASDTTIVTKKEKTKVQKEEVIKNIVVEIKGAVVTPGVYSLKEGSRVIDLITLAGGLVEDANTDYINQSKILADQMVVKIYTNQEIEKSNRIEVVTKYVEKECDCPKITNDACINNNSNNQDKENNNTSLANNLVNINTCTLEQLLTLPGIGESKALAIIEYRNSNKFEKIEDIQNVTGIGASLYEKVKNYIEV